MTEEEKLIFIAHEINAPLNVIKGYLCMIQKKDMGKTLEEYDSVIARCISRLNNLSDLTNKILFESQEIENPKKEVPCLTLDDNIISEIISTYNSGIEEKNLSLNITPTKEHTLTINPNHFRIILNNLISNAVKYNKQNGNIDLNINYTNKNLEINIKDTGIGIDRSELNNIFDKFYRVKPINKNTPNGLGLGLSYVKKITDIYSGKILIKSTLKQGTEISISIPQPEKR